MRAIVVGRTGNEKTHFHFTFFIQDISVNKILRHTKFGMHTDEIQMEGTVSQIFEIELSFDLMKCRKLFWKKSTKSSRFLTYK